MDLMTAKAVGDWEKQESRRNALLREMRCRHDRRQAAIRLAADQSILDTIDANEILDASFRRD